MAATNLLTMATSSSSLALLIPPITVQLDRDNYSLWRSTVVSSLEAFDLESHVLKPTPPAQTRLVATAEGEATSETNPAFTAWKKRDRFVLLWLRSTLTERALSSVVRATTAHTAWTTIERSFQSQTRARRMHLKAQLQSFSKGALTMIEYIDKKRAIVDSLAEDLTPVSDEELISYILGGLDSSYAAFTTAFMMKTGELSVDDLVGLLLQEEARQDHTRTHNMPLLLTPTIPPVAAFSTDRHSGRSSPHKPNNNNNRRYQSGGSSNSRFVVSSNRPICQL
ncbi:Retrovirus-related Pol polyprotein from transposon RE1 [Linum grandiflorum]